MLCRNAGDLAFEHRRQPDDRSERVAHAHQRSSKDFLLDAGMGIAFTEIPDRDRPQLEEIIRQLAIEPSAMPEPTPSEGPNLLMIIDASAALNAVANFFQSHRTLTREEFKGLVGSSQNHNGAQDR
jgi:hypothetical protein